MRDLLKDFLLSAVIVLIIWSTVKAETVYYETFENTTIRDISKPKLYEEKGKVYQTFPRTTIPDYSKPVYSAEPQPKFPASQYEWNLRR